jgi:hypothetical protein
MTNTYLDLTPAVALNGVSYSDSSRVLAFTYTKPGITDTANTTITLPIASTSKPGLVQPNGTATNYLNGYGSWTVPYTHPTGDGNLHVPATGTFNNDKFLKAGRTAGSLSWTTLDIAIIP